MTFGSAQRIGLRMADAAKEAWLLIVVPILAGFLSQGRTRLRRSAALVRAFPPPA
jgi:hypothetical protein